MVGFMKQTIIFTSGNEQIAWEPVLQRHAGFQILSKLFIEIIVSGNRAGQNVVPFFLCGYIAGMEN